MQVSVSFRTEKESSDSIGNASDDTSAVNSVSLTMSGDTSNSCRHDNFPPCFKPVKISAVSTAGYEDNRVDRDSNQQPDHENYLPLALMVSLQIELICGVSMFGAQCHRDVCAERSEVCKVGSNVSNDGSSSW